MITKNANDLMKKSMYKTLKNNYQQEQTEEERLLEAQEQEENNFTKEEVMNKKEQDEYNKKIENQVLKENSFIKKTIAEQEKFEEQQKIERDKKEKEIELQKKAEEDYEKIQIREVKSKIDEEIEKYKKENDSSYNYFKSPFNDFKREVYFFVKFITKKDMIYIIENIKDESFNKYENDNEILAYFESEVINKLLINFYKLNVDEIYSSLEDNEAFNEEINEKIQREKRIQARSKKNKEERIEREKREEKERIEREREELKQRREKERELQERIERENKRFINKLKKIFKFNK